MNQITQKIINIISDIFKKIDEVFTFDDLFFECFTHPSYSNENNNSESYQRLEFFGDSILGLLVAEFLFTQNKNIDEGSLTKLRARFVDTESNANYARLLSLDKCLLLGEGAKADIAKGDISVMADIFESFLGAIYLCYGVEVVKKILRITTFNDILNNPNKVVKTEYISLLQEYFQSSTKRSPVEFILESEEGPPNQRVFTYKVMVNGLVFGRGKGKRIQEAKANAAKEAYDKCVRG